MKRPFFSIITPVYNIERLIASTIESVLEQTFDDWEMICIDDGSPDSAGHICDKFAQKDGRIKVIHKQNAGLAAARNSGIQMATGKYFIILEGSDTFFDRNTLNNIYFELKDHPVDIYFGLLQDKMEKTGEIVSVQAKYSVEGLWKDGGAELVCHLYDKNDILALSSPVNKVVRKDFLLENDLWFYEGIYHDDDEWVPRTIAYTQSTYFSNHIIYNALTWDGCFGGNVSEIGLTKKAVDKMFIAEHCCKYFAEHFPNEKELRRRVYTYYVRMYNDAILNYYKIKNKVLKSQVREAAEKHKAVFQYFQLTDSSNIKILQYIYKFFGLNAVFYALKLRNKQ